MWRELIRECHPPLEPLGGHDPGPEFSDGATPEEIASVERQLSVQLPRSLRDLLTDSNGVYVVFGTHLIWSTAEMLSRNLEMRNTPTYQENYMPFDNLLFFADAGVDGIQFAFAIVQGAIKNEHVYLWNPYDDSRTWRALSLKTYLEGLPSGKLKV